MTAVKDTLESLLSRAKEQERRYDWAGAAKSIDGALAMSLDMSPDREGELLERMAYDTSKSAFQASTNDEFRQLVSASIGLFRKAIDAYKRSPDTRANGIATRCDAMCSHLSYWTETDMSKKKRFVKESWEATRDALAVFSASKDYPNLALTYNRLHFNAFLGWYYDEDHDTRSTILSEFVRYGDEAVENLASANLDPEESARVLVHLGSSIDSHAVYHPVSPEEWKKCQQRIGQCLLRATELSMEVATSEAVYESLSLGDQLSLAHLKTDPLGTTDEKNFEEWGANKLLDSAKKTRDRLSQGLAHSYAAGRLDWTGAGSEVPEDAERLFKLAFEHSAETRRHFACLEFVAPDFLWLPWPSAPALPWYYFRLYNLETDLRKKRTLATRLLSEARDLLRFAELSGYPWAVGSCRWFVALALDAVADSEDDEGRRMTLAKEALGHFGAAIEAFDIFQPGHLWNKGICRINCARIEHKLVGFMKDGVDRVALAKSSTAHFREALQLMDEWTTVWNEEAYVADKTSRGGLGLWWNWYGRALRTEFEILGDRAFLKSAIEAFEKAAEEAAKGEWESRAAESLWEAAGTCGLLEEYSRSSKEFDRASVCYTKAAEKIKSLREYYRQYAAYMRAWAEIEKAKLRHSRQEPSAARDHYLKASELHTSSRRWDYLSTNYSALAELENAEDLSQKEDFTDSIRSFGEATRLFSESKEALKKRLDKIEGQDERGMVSRLIEATDVRKDFCAARSTLEEARLLDKRGEMSDASDRYGQAAEMLRAILNNPAAGQNTKEVGLIITLANAWRAMSRAEAEASPELYEEAARLFEEAKEASPGERAKNLTLGHSRFCKALGIGARFADESDPNLHRAATDHLESAARYYTKARYDTAAEYARASKLLFDAYAQMGVAGKEADPQKKAKSFAMAEKLLEASAASYGKVGQAGRKEQVLKMLDRAKREKLLAISLTEVFLAPDEASSTLAFSSPSLTQESAVGLDRFEHADVQATLIARPKTMNVGQELVLEVELVNAGRGPAQLTKIDKVIPKGFDVVSEPEKCRVEDSYVNMKGKRLNALKTDDVKLVLRPSVHGEFQLRPRIMYLDESGKYKSCEPDSVTIIVKELGITGWLKGPERKGG